MTETASHKINWPTIIVVAALLIGFYFFMQYQTKVREYPKIQRAIDLSPEERMAQIQEGVDDPSNSTIDKFHEQITTIFGVYRIRSRREIADAIIGIYNINKRHYKDLLSFTKRFIQFIGTSQRPNSEKLLQGDIESDLSMFTYSQ